MDILGVRIDAYTKQEAIDVVRAYMKNGKQHMIFTPNPEMLVDAQKDKYFRTVLNSGSLNICDGKGIELVSGGKLRRIPGVDFIQEICNLAEAEGKSIYLLGSGDKKIVEEAKRKLETRNKKLHIVGIHPGPRITMKQLNNETMTDVEKQENIAVMKSIIDSLPDILFVAFGHGKQEKWIYEHLKKLPSVKVAMGVGGAFDYISGKKKRAPAWMQRIGFEWSWRLMREPRRVKRIWKATMVFLYYAFREHKKTHHETS